MDAFIGEVRLFAGDWTPKDWAFCDGRELKVRDNAPLFALIGAAFGGDGRTTFRLPDLRGRAPAGAGQSGDLTDRLFAHPFGAPDTTFTQTIQHDHRLRGAGAAGNATAPARTAFAYSPTTIPSAKVSILTKSKAHDVTLSASALMPGGGQPAPRPHSNMPPHQLVNFIICVRGEFPVLEQP